MAKDPDKLVQRQLLLITAAIGLFVGGVVVSSATIFSVGASDSPSDSPRNDGSFEREKHAPPEALARQKTNAAARLEELALWPYGAENSQFSGVPGRFLRLNPGLDDIGGVFTGPEWKRPPYHSRGASAALAGVNWSTGGYTPTATYSEAQAFSSFDADLRGVGGTRYTYHAPKEIEPLLITKSLRTSR